jgi:hypothetical protein
VNIAGFLGSFYRVGILSGRDVHRCLDALLNKGVHFLKLLAAHALFVQCGDRICAGDSGAQTALLRQRISERSPGGRFVWGQNDEGHVLVLVVSLAYTTLGAGSRNSFRTCWTTSIGGLRRRL